MKSLRCLLIIVAVAQLALASQSALEATATKEQKVIKTLDTTLGAKVFRFADTRLEYQWDTLYGSEAYKDAKVGETLTDDFIATVGGKQLLVRMQVTKRPTVEASKQTQSKMVSNPMLGQTPGGGVLYVNVQTKAQEYYAGFVRQNLEYLNLKPGEEFVDKFKQVEQVCGPKVCYRVTGFVLNRAEKAHQLPIKTRIEQSKEIVHGPGLAPQPRPVQLSEAEMQPLVKDKIEAIMKANKEFITWPQHNIPGYKGGELSAAQLAKWATVILQQEKHADAEGKIFTHEDPGIRQNLEALNPAQKLNLIRKVLAEIKPWKLLAPAVPVAEPRAPTIPIAELKAIVKGTVPAVLQDKALLEWPKKNIKGYDTSYAHLKIWAAEILKQREKEVFTHKDEDKRKALEDLKPKKKLKLIHEALIDTFLGAD